MATATEAPSSPTTSAADDAPFDLTIDLLSAMVEGGLIPLDRRVYLRDGRLFEKMAKTKPHGFVGAAINMALVPRLPAGWGLWLESTIVLDPRNAPLPDFAVVRGASPLDYAEPARYPGPGDVGLLIEVAVSSLRSDLTTALELYARASIPVYWVVDVLGRRILAHAEPRVVDGRGEYARVETHRPGQAVPLVLDGREVARVPIDELLR
jgi:Uma2 family endonuclease